MSSKELSSDSKVADSTNESNAGGDVEASSLTFGNLGLDEGVLKTITDAGYKTPTPIQAQAIPLLLEGRDVLGQAQTGTGKTAAFALPLVQRIDPKNKQVQVLVLAPTRELAIQVAESFEKYARSVSGLRVASIYGGQSYQPQLSQLNRGVQVVVGTPGRVMDHIRKGSLSLDGLQCLVLDEADEMLRMGFAEDVDWVLTQAPKKRQMALFSATMPMQIRRIAQTHLNNPAEVTIKQKAATAETVNQRYLIATPYQKQMALTRLLESESIDGVLVFVKMRSTTEPLADKLAQSGFRTAALNGDMAQRQRERIIESLKAGRVDIIVATDVAARGLDVQRISHVINYDLPHDSEAYVHRIGRTGRAGRSGEAIIFVSPRERRFLKRLEQATRKKITEMAPPSNRDINKHRVATFHTQITEALEHKEIETFQAIVDHYQRENPDTPMEQIAAALAVMANGGRSLLVKGEAKQATFDNSSRGDRSNGGRPNKYRGSKGGGKSYAGKSSGKGGFSGKRSSQPMTTHRLEVGKNQQVQPGAIVRAIAQQTGISGKLIGKINIFDKYSTVDLPQSVSNDDIHGVDKAVSSKPR